MTQIWRNDQYLWNFQKIQTAPQFLGWNPVEMSNFADSTHESGQNMTLKSLKHIKIIWLAMLYRIITQPHVLSKFARNQLAK